MKKSNMFLLAISTVFVLVSYIGLKFGTNADPSLLTIVLFVTFSLAVLGLGTSGITLIKDLVIKRKVKEKS